jgi:hypothetical protein
MTVALQVLTVMVVTFISIFLILTLVSMSVHWKNYIYYKMTYFAILNCTYVMVRNSYSQQTYHRPDDPNPYSNDEIIFFLDNGRDVDSIKLLSRGQHYIHDKGGIDLYARYWFRKIMKVRDKYNHQLWVSTTQSETGENMLDFYIPQKQSFKFLRG